MSRAGKREEQGRFAGDPRSSPITDGAPIEPPKATTVSEVEQHNAAVRQRSADRACYRKLCARCGQAGPFAPHELRRRGLRLIDGHSVLCLVLWLARWRCRGCRHVFTDYPDFRTAL